LTWTDTSVNEPEKTHLDLFSGIGGFALAANDAGHRTVAFCEQDRFCQGVLERWWPGVPIVDDVRDLDGKDYEGVTLLTGGFPCQPYSCAGKRRGEKDDRALGGEMVRVISEALPAWVLGENVAGFTNMGLDAMLSDLEGLGYACQTFIIPACSLNAPHRRDRVWIVAHSDRQREIGNKPKHGQRSRTKQDRENVAHSEGLGHRGRDRQERGTPQGELFSQEQAGRQVGGEAQGRREPSGESQDVAHSDAARRGEHGGAIAIQAEQPPIEHDCGGTGNHWDLEPDVGRVAHGIPSRTHRLRALGNSIVPQVAAEIIRAMQ